MEKAPRRGVVLAAGLVWLAVCGALVLGLRHPLTRVEEVSPPVLAPVNSIEYGISDVGLEAGGLTVSGFIYQLGEGETPVHCQLVVRDLDTGRCYALPTMLTPEESRQAPGQGYDVGYAQRAFYASATGKELRRAGLEPGARLALFLYYENNGGVFWVDAWRHVNLTE